jgi:hypothetical protein
MKILILILSLLSMTTCQRYVDKFEIFDNATTSSFGIK